MFRNYVIAALRNLARNPLYAALNIGGVALGFTAALLIVLYVRDELSYENFIPGYRDTYLVATTGTPPEGHAPIKSFSTPSHVAAWINLDMATVASAARLTNSQIVVRRGDFEALESVYWADPNIVSILPLAVFAGNLATALDQPDGLVLTRTMARKYFGRDNVVGETLELKGRAKFTVKAVLEDLPSNTHLNVAMFASGTSPKSPLTQLDQTPLSSFPEDKGWLYIYVRLKKAQATNVERELPGLLDRHSVSGGAQPTSSIWHLSLEPINQIHLDPEGLSSMKPASRRETVYSFAAIGTLIVFVASANFVSMMTARASRRAIEVGVRKAMGARRRELIVQFMGESLIYVLLATLAALSVAKLSLPILNAYLKRTIAFAYWSDPSLAASTATIVVMVGALAAIYPALVLSALRPVQMLGKGGITTAQSSDRVRRALVTAQFAVLIGLILAVIVLFRQASFATHESLRMDSDQVVVIGHACRNGFEDAVKAISGVRAVACSNWAPPDPVGSASGATAPGGQSTIVWYASIDFGYFELFGLEPLAGRFHSKSRSTDAFSVGASSEIHDSLVINESAVRALGFPTPQSSIGQMIEWSHFVPGLGQTGRHLSEVIGVVPDFQTSSIREPIEPAAFYVDLPHNGVMSIKLSGRDIPQSLASIDALWKKMGNGYPISPVFLDQLLQDKYTDITQQAQLLAAFAGVAVLIACLGLFALSASAAERRTKEIAVRKAMGASTAQVMRLLVWQFCQPVVWANLIAWPVAGWVMNRWLSGFAYHVDLDVWFFVASACLALTIALLTVSAHCFLVARAKPAVSLRYE
jgi:putative ABC transport system permease protein